MKVLVLADRGVRAEAVTAELERCGHKAVVAGGRGVVPAVLRAARPDAVLVVSEDPGEARAWVESLDSAKGMGVWALRAGAGPLEVQAVVTAVTSGGVTIPRLDEDSWVVDVSAAPEAPAASDPAPQSAQALQTFPERDRILAKLQQVRNASYYDVLELDSGATSATVRARHEALAGAFSPERFAGRVGETFEEHLCEIASGLDDAYYVLGDDDLRQAYRAALLNADQGSGPFGGG